MDATLYRLVTGDDVINDVIIMETKLAIMLSTRFLVGRDFSKQQDIRAAALLGLVEGVHRISENHDQFQVKDVRPYLNRTITNTIIEFFRSDFIITIPSRTRRRAEEAGTPITPPKVFSIHSNPDDDIADFDIPDYRVDVQVDTNDLQAELLRRLSPLEKKVLELRLIDYNQSDIAKITDRSVQRISQVMLRIREKYDAIPTYFKRETILQRQRFLQSKIAGQEAVCEVRSDNHSQALCVL